MENRFRINALAASFLLAMSTGTLAFENSDALNSKLDLSFRYRIETVDQAGIHKDAFASTLRTRATLTTDWSTAIETILEFDDVSIIGVDDFNSGQGTSPGKGNYPVVADPEGTEINQFFIRYKSGSNSTALGRQRILRGNQRFVGGVGWRQNEQTYDSFSYSSKFNKNLAFNYAYVFNVNRIFGETVNAGDHSISVSL